MNRIATSPAAFALAALLLAGCAAKAPHTQPMATAPMAAPDPMMMMPSGEAKTIALEDTVLPEGGELVKGTKVAGVKDWAAHGVMDGVAWRFGPADGAYLRVAGKAGVEWQYIQVAESWGVVCKAEPGGKTTPCSVLRIQPLHVGGMASGGISLDEHLTCVSTDVAGEDAEITVDGGPPHIFPAATRCIAGGESDTLQQEMLAGQNILVKAHFQPAGPPETMSLSSTGLKQALALRAWIVDKYKSGDLSAVE